MMWVTSLLGTWQLKLAVVVIAFAAGWKVNGWRYDAADKKQQDEYISALHKQDDLNRKLAEDLQQKKQENQKLYDLLKGKVNDATDNRICFANIAALQLWNQALSGEPNVPKTSTGATSSTGGTTAITDKQLLDNQIENARRWKNLRDQVNDLRKWDEETFGKK